MDDLRKKDSLDQALLFSIGSVGLIISFLQINMNDLTQVIEALPFLVLGVLFPFVVGYLRGAIELDSIEERMRGWIYFLIGTSSYFAFFITFRIKASYLITESVFILILIFGVLMTNILLKWSKRVFRIQNPSIQYAYSGTVLGAAICAFLLRMLTSIFIDFRGQNVYDIITKSYSSLFFWISIPLLSFPIVLICEKASQNALQNKLELPKMTRKIQRLFPVRGTILGLKLFEYSFDCNLKARLLWILSFVFWFVGCIMLTAKADLLSSLFLMLMVIPWLVASVIFLPYINEFQRY